MSDSENKRGASRSPVAKGVEITVGNDTLKGTLEDISINGLSVSLDPSLPVGTEYRVSVLLETSDSDAVRIDTRARVTRLTDTGMALEFVEVDADSLSHLQNLIRYNAEDPDAAAEDIGTHIGIKGPPRGGGSA